MTVEQIPEILNEPCQCAANHCDAGVPEGSEARCINRLTGDVRTLRCDRCDAGTWHQDGKCLRCHDLVGPAAGMAA